MIKLLKDYALYIDETNAEYSLVRVINDEEDIMTMAVVKKYDDPIKAFDRIGNYLYDLIVGGGFNNSGFTYEETEECWKTLEFLKLKWM